MTNKEQDFILEVMDLMNKVPQASPNPYDMTGWIHAARDYEAVHNLVYQALTNYASWSAWKNKKDEVDEGWLEYQQEQYEKAFEELKSFITKRREEKWA